MKKLFTLITITFLGILSFTSAQSMGDIELKFCENDQEKQVDIVTKSDQDTQFCVLFRNRSTQDIKINVGFVDGALNNSGGKSCGIPSDPNKNFGQFIQTYEPEITIPGKQEIKKYYTIHYPAGFSGLSHGCITYNLINEQDNNTNGINLIFRRTFSIDILVGGSEIRPKLSIGGISITGDATSQKILLNINNKGNTDQKINLTGIIKNRFGYSENFEIPGTIVPANQNLTIESSSVTIPSYKGLFFIKSNLENIPIFNFDITNTAIGNEYSIPSINTISNTIFLRNWVYIILISIIIILIILICIKYRKNNTQKRYSNVKKTSHQK